MWNDVMKVVVEGKEQPPQFRRKGSPPPNATKLLTFSVLSGVGLLIVLAIVFLPQGIQYSFQEYPPQIRLSAATGSIVLVSVSQADRAVELTKFRIDLYREGSLAASLKLAESHSSDGLAFSDNNGNGSLDVGDTISVAHVEKGLYKLLIVFEPRGLNAGFVTWTM